METATDRRAKRTALKKRVTAALNKKGAMNPVTTALVKKANPREPFVDGFAYGDDNGYHRVPNDENLERVGIFLEWRSNRLWGGGEYDKANADTRQMNFELAATLTRLGWVVTVDHHAPRDPGRVVIWADENEGV